MIRIDTRDKKTDELISVLIRKLNVPNDADITVCSADNIPKVCDTLTIAVCKNAEQKSDITSGNVHIITYPISFSAFAELVALHPATESNKEKKTSDFLFDEQNGTVEFSGKKANLTQKETELFSYLLKASPKAVSREELRHVLWKGTENTNAPDVYVSYLRRKLRPIFGDGVIVNERGVGYILKNIT